MLIQERRASKILQINSLYVKFLRRSHSLAVVLAFVCGSFRDFEELSEIMAFVLRIDHGFLRSEYCFYRNRYSTQFLLLKKEETGRVVLLHPKMKNEYS